MADMENEEVEVDGNPDQEEEEVQLDDVLDVASHISDIISYVIPKTRQCSVQINNQSRYILRNPKLHMDSGLCANPLPISIKPESSGEGLFVKNPKALRGSGGVFTYDLYHPDRQMCEGRMAVLYKVPLDMNFRFIGFAIGIMEMDTECDKHLFHKMYSKKASDFVRGKAGASCLSFESGVVTIRANMSNIDKAIMKIEVSNE